MEIDLDPRRHAEKAAELLRMAEDARVGQQRLLRQATAEATVATALWFTRPVPPAPAKLEDGMQSEKTLHEQLTALYGPDWAKTVADMLYVRLLGPKGPDHDPILEGDPIVAPYFMHYRGVRVDRELLEKHQAWFLESVTGGRRWSRESVKVVHASVKHWQTGRPITNEVFDRVAFHVVGVLQELKVPQPIGDEMVKIVESLRGDLVAA